MPHHASDVAQMAIVQGCSTVISQLQIALQRNAQQAVGSPEIAEFHLHVADAVERRGPQLLRLVKVPAAIGIDQLQSLNIVAVSGGQVAYAAMTGAQTVQYRHHLDGIGQISGNGQSGIEAIDRFVVERLIVQLLAQMPQCQHLAHDIILIMTDGPAPPGSPGHGSSLSCCRAGHNAHHGG